MYAHKDWLIGVFFGNTKTVPKSLN